MFHFLFIMFVWSYVQTVRAKIVIPPTNYHLPYEVRENLDKAPDEQHFREILEDFVKTQNITVSNKAFEGGVRFCPTCSCIKPDRAHHCSVCGHCILKFDHHCPWVNTCINFANYKFFVLFLGYGFFLCSFGSLSILPFFISFWDRERYSETSFGMLNTLFLFFVSGMFALSFGGLFFYHIYLTVKNKTTIETFRPPIFSYGIDKEGYNLDVKRNWTLVFGTKPLLHPLPIYTSVGDGIRYIHRLISHNSPGIDERVTYHLDERPFTLNGGAHDTSSKTILHDV